MTGDVLTLAYSRIRRHRLPGKEVYRDVALDQRCASSSATRHHQSSETPALIYHGRTNFLGQFNFYLIGAYRILMIMPRAENLTKIPLCPRTLQLLQTLVSLTLV